MQGFKTSKTHYIVKEKIGDGLTSQVYRAFRVHMDGMIQQEVALKILNSEKDFQIFKREFENLLKIRSKYCVKILAWEKIDGKKALVLEYVKGKSLAELKEKKILCLDHWYEILAQVLLGLQDLHEQNICHGDLNFSNILVDQNGLVKLIDFGNEDPVSGNQLTTREFSSPSRLSGLPANKEDDLYSLKILGRHLIGRSFKLNQIGKSSASRRRSLAKKVNSKWSVAQTIFVKKPAKKMGFQFLKLGVCVSVFLFVSFFNQFSNKKTTYHSLTLQSDQWFRYSINGLPMSYGPLHGKNLRLGQYQIEIESAYGNQEIKGDLQDDLTFLLQPSGKNLR